MALPTRPISASIERPQPLGQPVTRSTTCSSDRPCRAISSSMRSENCGRKRSDSAMASGHVGSETQAMEFSRCGVT